MAELQTKFFTDISHELRTPLTLIAGPLERLVEEATPENQSSIRLMRHNTQRLVDLVNQTLDLNKLTNGQMPLSIKKENLGEIVRRNVDSFAEMARKKEIELEFDASLEDSEVAVDASKMDLILVNLLGNAFNHTQKGGSIAVRLHRDHDQIDLTLEDTGKGIDKVHQSHIFKRFYQVDQSSPTGTGIGLALTKELVELHQGSISLESDPGQGSTFKVSIPADLPVVGKSGEEPDSQGITESACTDERKATVLVVEDNSDVQEYVAGLLRPHYQVITADNGREGIESAQEHNPELIVSDVMMPEVEGLELTRHLKESLATSHIPIVLLTAKGAHEHKMQGLESGADDYLIKPFKVDELLVRIKNLINQRRRLREIFSENVFVRAEEVTTNQLDEAFLNHATTIVEEHFSDAKFNVEALCKALAKNRNTVHQKLTALTGLSGVYFIRSIRLKKAAELLLNEEYSIVEVSELAGYNSRQAFNKAFKAQFNPTPTEYRKKGVSTPT